MVPLLFESFSFMIGLKNCEKNFSSIQSVFLLGLCSLGYQWCYSFTACCLAVTIGVKEPIVNISWVMLLDKDCGHLVVIKHLFLGVSGV